MSVRPQTVPTYSLYGETLTQALPEGFHCESIAQRSRLYNWEIEPHRHEHFSQVLIIRSGGGSARLGKSDGALAAPCALFVPRGVVHGFRFSHDIDGVVITVVSRWLERVLESVPGLAASFGAARLFSLGRNPEELARIGRLEQALLDEWHDSGPWWSTAIEAALTLMLLALARIGGPRTPDEDDHAPRSAQHMRRFAALIEQSFRKQRSIGHYAGRLGLTTTQLNRICRQVLGTSALGVLNRRLLTEARRDLAYSSLSVKAIALTLGFADAAYFSRFFTKHAGCSPTAYRREVQRQLLRD